MNRHTPPEIAAVFDAPYSTVSITPGDMADHTIMRARQLAALLLAMQDEAGPDSLLWLAQQLADELQLCIERQNGLKGKA